MTPPLLTVAHTSPPSLTLCWFLDLAVSGRDEPDASGVRASMTGEQRIITAECPLAAYRRHLADTGWACSLAAYFAASRFLSPVRRLPEWSRPFIAGRGSQLAHLRTPNRHWRPWRAAQPAAWRSRAKTNSGAFVAHFTRWMMDPTLYEILAGRLHRITDRNGLACKFSK